MAQLKNGIFKNPKAVEKMANMSTAKRQALTSKLTSNKKPNQNRPPRQPLSTTTNKGTYEAGGPLRAANAAAFAVPLGTAKAAGTCLAGPSQHSKTPQPARAVLGAELQVAGPGGVGLQVARPERPELQVAGLEGVGVGVGGVSDPDPSGPGGISKPLCQGGVSTPASGGPGAGATTGGVATSVAAVIPSAAELAKSIKVSLLRGAKF